MSPPLVILTVLAAFVISALLARRFCNPDSVIYVLDHPNDRSLHDRPVPRGGGVAVLVALLICGAAVALAYPIRGLAGIVSGVMIVAAASLADDRHTVPPLYRLAAHVAAAIFVVYSGFFLEKFELPALSWDWSHLTGAAFSVLYVVWMINLYNFMDGMDGFAGGMAVIGFGSFSILGAVAGHEAFLAINLVIAAAAAGFLVFNFPPARIFMGDVGSSVLGMLAAVFSLWGVRDGIFPFWVAILVFSPFIVDASVTLIRRLFSGEIIWKPHKSHYYQKLVQAGWGHRKTVLVEYVFMLGCNITALLSMHVPVAMQVAALVVWFFFYMALFSWISWYTSRRRGSV